MNKSTFNKLTLQKQVQYFNERLLSGENISQICNSINISYSTIRDRFKRNNYAYNKIYNQYQNTTNLITNPEVPKEIIDSIILQLNSRLSNLKCDKRDSKLTSRSFRVHSCILDDFIKFCNSSTFTQQEILSQFIAEGLNKYRKEA